MPCGGSSCYFSTLIDTGEGGHSTRTQTHIHTHTHTMAAETVSGDERTGENASHNGSHNVSHNLSHNVLHNDCNIVTDIPISHITSPPFVSPPALQGDGRGGRTERRSVRVEAGERGRGGEEEGWGEGEGGVETPPTGTRNVSLTEGEEGGQEGRAEERARIVERLAKDYQRLLSKRLQSAHAGSWNERVESV